MRRVLIIIAILLLPGIPIVLVVTGVLKSKPQTVRPVQLTVWGTEENEKAMSALIAKYRATRSYMDITYTTVRPEEYAKQLVSAWAQGTGPDVFFAPSTWVGTMAQYAVPMPADLTVKQVITSKALIGTTTKVVTSPKAAPSLASLRNQFVEAVSDDVVMNGQVWGLPLSMDTVALYYNKALTNNAKIFEPAATWSDLQNQITNNKLTVTDEQGHLVQSGVALGTTTNVPYATDILALLMMQNGSVMTSADKQAHLNEDAGLQATKFFLSFAQPQKTNYSWDANQTNARDAFIQGKVGYFFGTLADKAAITTSTLNWGVAPMLHIRSTGDNDGQTSTERYIDTARYNVAMVSKASESAGRSVQAWNFIEYVTRGENASTYTGLTSQLSAVKAILSQQSNDPDLGTFAKQLLTAKSWYHGHDWPAVEGYLEQLVTAGLAGKTDLTELIDLANTQIQSTL